MKTGVDLFDAWLKGFAQVVDPFAHWTNRQVAVSHPDEDDGATDDPDGPVHYPAVLQHHPEFDLRGAVPAASTGSTQAQAEHSALFSKAVARFPNFVVPRYVAPPRAIGNLPGVMVVRKKADQPLPEGGRWITVHPNGPDEEGHPVYIVPNADGSHSIVGGAGGALNGLRLTHVKSEAEYRRHAVDVRDRKKKAKQAADAQLRAQMTAQEYAQHIANRKIVEEQSRAAQRSAEREFIGSVLKARGLDASQLDPPKEALAGLDKDTAEGVARKHHEALLAYANRVVDATRSAVRKGFADLAGDKLGDLSAGDIASSAMTGEGGGYAARLADMASEHGLNAEGAQSIGAAASWRSLVERTGSEGAAQQRMDSSEKGRAAAAEKREKVTSAAQDLAAQGFGPDVVRALSSELTPETLGSATDLLAAHKAMQQKVKSAKQAREEAGDATPETLPKAAALISKPISEEQARKLVADDLAEDSRRDAMMRLMGQVGEVEKTGNLRAHVTTGAQATLNTIAQAVDRSSVDPLLVDTLGVSGAARVLAARWRNALPPEEFERVRQTLVDHHVRTQVDLAEQAIQETTEHLERADAIDIEKPLGGSTAELLAATAAVEEKAVHQRAARESIGQARGRLEAAAAVNEAMMRKGGDLLIPFANKSPAEAALHLAALGLTQPSTIDDDGNVVDQGQYTLSHDGVNAVATIHPEGVRALDAGHDPELEARANRSRAIKLGENDEGGWSPAGVTKRSRTVFDFNPESFVQTGHVLRLGGGESPEDTQAALREHVGAMIQEGQDPFDALSNVSSASFVAGLGLSAAAEKKYRDALATIAPQPPSGRGMTADEHAAALVEHRASVREALVRCADDWAEAQAGERAAIDRQRLDEAAPLGDLAYQVAGMDPRTAYAFHAYGELDRPARDAIRRYAYEHVFGLDPKSDEILTPLSEGERKGYALWQDLQAQGDPYKAIQQRWAQEQAAQGGGLFGDEEDVPVNPLASIDLGDDTAVMEAAKGQWRTLGYDSPTDPYLTASQGPDGLSDHTVVREARRRVRRALRSWLWENHLGDSEMAGSGFNPERVLTASGRWADYCKSMGGERKAFETIQESMRGDFVQKFAAGYQQVTGKSLDVASQSLRHAKAHVQALGSTGGASDADAAAAAIRARVQRRVGGRFGTEQEAGAVGAKVEAQQAAADLGPALLGAADVGARGGGKVAVARPSIGAAAEAQLAALVPKVDLSRPMEAASDLDFSNGDNRKIQRAIKLICENRRQGLNLAAGSGKSLCIIGSLGELRARGEVKRAIITTPANVVGQMGGEFYKFADPSTGLNWHADPGASAEEREAAMSDPNTHAVVMTPESLREHIVRAVGKDMGMERDAAMEHLGGLSEGERDRVIGDAMAKRGWNFEMSVFDEFHRLQDRKGKADSGMSQIGASVGRLSAYHVLSSADVAKNDPSEALSLLQKLDGDRYNEGRSGAFLRRHMRGSAAGAASLQRELEPYVYADRVDYGVGRSDQVHVLPMPQGQQGEHDRILDAYRSAAKARALGGSDLEALRVLAPSAFEGGDPDAEKVENLNRALGGLRDTALERVVNTHPDGAKLAWVRKYLADNPDKRVIVFGRLSSTVHGLADALTADGESVVRLTGDMTPEAKMKAQQAFSPPSGDPSARVIVASNAAAAGGNLQRGNVVIHVDTPQTATTAEQRAARAYRRGQTDDVDVHHLVADCDFEHRARKRLAKKAALRDLLTSKAEEIDDSGLLLEVQKARAAAMEDQYATAR